MKSLKTDFLITPLEFSDSVFRLEDNHFKNVIFFMFIVCNPECWCWRISLGREWTEIFIQGVRLGWVAVIPEHHIWTKREQDSFGASCIFQRNHVAVWNKIWKVCVNTNDRGHRRSFRYSINEQSRVSKNKQVSLQTPDCQFVRLEHSNYILYLFSVGFVRGFAQLPLLWALTQRIPLFPIH